MGEVLAVFRVRAPTITERLKEAKGLIIWREDAPANWATRLEGLTHSPPLHATRQTWAIF